MFQDGKWCIFQKMKSFTEIQLALEKNPHHLTDAGQRDDKDTANKRNNPMSSFIAQKQPPTPLSGKDSPLAENKDSSESSTENDDSDCASRVRLRPVSYFSSE
jgi:hypothetical protein